ncbi:MAG: response regulator transcription factor [Chloroflexi bacterium]|jgi:DNA-binding NarL/FixJ family response regulator|nr:response regulator transcription factor [Chloroflexota bacterium]
MSEKRIIRIVLADDHPLVVEGLSALLSSQPDMRVVATATDGERLLEAIERFHPDVIVMDLQMPYMGGVSCLRHIRARELPVRVLVLSAFGDADSLRAAIEAGADGFVLKTESPQHTIIAVRQIAEGQLVFPQAARRWLGMAADDTSALTEREEEILKLLAEGLSNAQIGARLHLSENTIKFHLRNIYAKLGVSNRTEAALKYRGR